MMYIIILPLTRISSMLIFRNSQYTIYCTVYVVQGDVLLTVCTIMVLAKARR